MLKATKAEVLEHAVDFVGTVLDGQSSTPKARQTAYTDGFKDCTEEVLLYLARTGSASKHTMHALKRHLRNVHDKGQKSTSTGPVGAKKEFLLHLQCTCAPDAELHSKLWFCSFHEITDFNNNNALAMTDSTLSTASADVKKNFPLASSLKMPISISLSKESTPPKTDENSGNKNSPDLGSAARLEVKAEMKVKQEPIWRPW